MQVGQGIVVKGQHNKMKSVVISEASGGIIIEADNNQLFYNSVNIQAPSITLEENTCCGFLVYTYIVFHHHIAIYTIVRISRTAMWQMDE